MYGYRYIHDDGMYEQKQTILLKLIKAAAYVRYARRVVDRSPIIKHKIR